MVKFKELSVGDLFTFSNSPSFFSVCKKVSARCYTWHNHLGDMRRSEVGTTGVAVNRLAEDAKAEAQS